MNSQPISSAASATPRQTHRMERCALSLVVLVLAASPPGSRGSVMSARSVGVRELVVELVGVAIALRPARRGPRLGRRDLAAAMDPAPAGDDEQPEAADHTERWQEPRELGARR